MIFPPFVIVPLEVHRPCHRPNRIPLPSQERFRRHEVSVSLESTRARKNIQRPLSTVGAVVAQPETQVVLKGTNGEMEPANSPDDVGLTLREGSPRL